MRSSVIMGRAALWAVSAVALSGVSGFLGARVAPVGVVLRGEKNGGDREPVEGEPGYKRQMARRLWNRIGRRKEEKAVEEVLDAEENKGLYASLSARREEVVVSKVEDTEIYDALSKKGDFPMVSKKLSEALQNRSLTTGMLPPVLTSQDFSDFAPSSGQTPGEVISGVLKALKDGAAAAEGAEASTNAGVETLLRFMSPASAFYSGEVDSDAYVNFVLDSEYDLLLQWDQMVFDGTMRLSMDGTKAYQTVRLLDGKSGAWSKTKWALSLRTGEDCEEACDASDETGFWLIDNVIVSAR